MALINVERETRVPKNQKVTKINYNQPSKYVSMRVACTLSKTGIGIFGLCVATSVLLGGMDKLKTSKC